jgi:hypothetical protein
LTHQRRWLCACADGFDARFEPYQSTRFGPIQCSICGDVSSLAFSAARPPHGRSPRAQQKVPVIGFLGTTSPSAWREPIAAFERRLRELDWIAGRTITIDYRWTEGRNEQALAIAEAFVQRKVDICRRRQRGGGGEAGHRRNARYPAPPHRSGL